MGDFRISYGSALGKYANFFAKSDNIFSESDTTPDVTEGCLFFSNNTSNTTITHFDLRYPAVGATISQHFEGKRIMVVFLDGSTRLVNADRLFLAGSDGLQGANNVIELVYHNSAWIETNRSYNNAQIVTADSASLGTTGIVSVIGNRSVIRINASTGSDATLRRATNGEQGQVITLIASGASDALVIVNTAAADTFVTTTSGSTATQFRLMSSGAISFIRDGIKWLEIRPVSGNSSGQLQ